MSQPRTILAAGLTTIVVYAAARVVSAQTQPGPAAAATPNRIGVVNLEVLWQNFKRAQAYKAAREKVLQPLQTESEALKEKIAKQQSELKVANLDAGARRRLEENLNRDIKRLNDLQRDLNRLNSQKVAKEFVPLYKEIVDTVKTYARTQGIQLVLSYSEDPKTDPFSPPSIGRRINGLEGTGCAAPIYVDPAVDITAAVTDLLNRRDDRFRR
jgi:Skp family chaperone for outer membrane proteins